MNKPLQLLKYNVMYKIWLMDFPIDLDCHKMIKKLLYTLSMQRTFTIPSLTDINEYGFYDKHFTYINDQGVVFQSIHNGILKFSEYHCTELFSHQPMSSSTIKVDNINALYFYYDYHSGAVSSTLTINFYLSDIHYLIIHENVPNRGDYYHRLNINSLISCL